MEVILNKQIPTRRLAPAGTKRYHDEAYADRMLKRNNEYSLFSWPYKYREMLFEKEPRELWPRERRDLGGFLLQNNISLETLSEILPNEELRQNERSGKWYLPYRDWETDRKSTRLNSSHLKLSRMPSSA